MKSASIPSRWFRLHPHGRMDATFWVHVERVRAVRGIDANDDNAMRELIRDLETADQRAEQLSAADLRRLILDLLQTAQLSNKVNRLYFDSSYCECCSMHAPKDVDGLLTGPLEHRDDCVVGRALAATKDMSPSANLLDDLVDTLIVALPFFEDIKGDPCYKPGAAAKVEAEIRRVLKLAGVRP